jgi:hypothetical protein
VKRHLVVAAAVAVFSASADVQPEAVSETVTYRLDKHPHPRVLRTREDVENLREATCNAGATVTRTGPDGVTSTLVDTAPSVGSVALGIDAGGLWTFSNTAEGEATFAVRHSPYGTFGSGTADSPFKIVDRMELFELSLAGGAGLGSCYTFVGLQGVAPFLPPRFSGENVCENVYRLVADPNSLPSDACGYLLDTRLNGPDRIVDARLRYFIAYSGDDWAFGANAVSAVTVTAPDGLSRSQDFTGTDATRFRPAKRGDYLVKLTAGGRTLTAVITYIPLNGMTFLVK